MAEKKKKKTTRKYKSKSEKKRIEAGKREDKQTKKKNSNAEHEGAKYRVTFLVAQSFRGEYYKAGEYIDLPENDAKAYSSRSTLKIEAI